MLIRNHPDDERLSALASRDPDATADATLVDHVSSCDRCTALVDELGALRASLAELPDLAPSRPLRLLPEVDEPARIDRLGEWARRAFAPILTAGAALALVGVVGTASPSFIGAGAQAGASPAAENFAAQASDAAGEPGAYEVPTVESANADALSGGGEAAAPAPSGEAAAPAPSVERALGEDVGDDGDAARLSDQALPERSPWPMVLFAGAALMVAAALLRWILVPRAE